MIKLEDLLLTAYYDVAIMDNIYPVTIMIGILCLIIIVLILIFLASILKSQYQFLGQHLISKGVEK